MGRSLLVKVVLGVMLVGGGALAQQGLIVEPWRRAPNAPTPAALVPRSLPASGLPGPGVASASAAVQPAPASDAPAPVPARWSPPVVELLVDPWVQGRLAAPAGQPGWAPHFIEIVDPWAVQPPAPPRVASRPTAEPPVPIF